jgi:predicted adenine nucleotide alpha hydrolase (AANH) superfamily ATPase
MQVEVTQQAQCGCIYPIANRQVWQWSLTKQGSAAVMEVLQQNIASKHLNKCVITE